jgi:hypothetical protein
VSIAAFVSMGMVHVALPTGNGQDVEEDILDIVNGTLEASTRGESLQVGVAGSTVWRVLREQQLLSLPSVACKSHVTARLPCAGNVLPVVLATVWYKS